MTQPRETDYGLMKQHEYQVMYEFEQHYWWYVALHDLVERLVSRVAKDKPPEEVELIDCGCGTGGMLARLKKTYPRATGFDFSPDAVRFCRSRGMDDVDQRSIVDFDYGEARFDAAVSLDVLCNLNEEQCARALERIFAALKPGGGFIFNLPAFDSLQSSHDRAVGVYRRFRRNRLKQELQEAGFAVDRINYRITWPFPAAWLIRTLRKRRVDEGEAHSDLEKLPRPIDSLLRGITRIENRIVTWLPMPFGLSVFGIARRPA